MSTAGHERDPSKTAPIASPDDTAHLDSPSGVAIDAARQKSESVIAAEAEKSGTNFDTLVGRMVIDQGLATNEEVQHCLTLRRTQEDPSGKSLTQLLVDNDYVTERQLIRLRAFIEAERSGQRIPGYKILSKLGAGAMAKVYKAKQLKLDRMVAIKVLPQKFVTNQQFIERFFAEGRAAAQLNHPNIVQAFDVGNVGDIYYFVMEYVDGKTVHDEIAANKRYNEADAIEVAIQVAEALDHAHSKGLIHRDVKPKNIMMSVQGVVKLADMGLARAISDKEAAEAEAGKAFGTPYYISPEQIRGERSIGPQADIYSLGATLYHMVTGSVPYEGKNPSAVMHKHLKAALQPPDHVNPKLSPHISEVIEMMMAKDVTQRYQTCKDLLSDLRAVKKGESPPLAHREIVPEDTLADLAAAEATAEPLDGIAIDKSSGSAGSVFREPMFVVLASMLFLSVLVNVVLVVLAAV